MSNGLLALVLSAAVAPLLASAAPLAAENKKVGPTAHGVAPPPSMQAVDINSAGRAQLKMLPGIGDAEADRIIAARPYPSKAKLVAAKVLPTQTYLAIKGRIVAVQRDPPLGATR